MSVESPCGSAGLARGNSHGDLGWARAHSLTFNRGTEYDRPFGVSISFGYAVLHLVHHGSDDHEMRVRMEAHRALKQIWPARASAVEWPPRTLFDDPDLTELPLLISRDSDFLPLRRSL